MSGPSYSVGAYPNGPDYSTYAQQFAAISAFWGQPPAQQDLYIYQGQAIATFNDSAGYYAGLFAGSAGKAAIPCIGFPLFSTVSTDGTSDQQLQAIAAGTYDSMITGCLDAYAGQGYKTQVWRVGWEMNLSGTAWFALLSANSPALWIAAFQHVYTVMHAHAAATGLTIQVGWNPGATSGDGAGRPDQVFWPGAEYVDIICLDLYQQLWPIQSGNGTYWDVTSNTLVPLSTWMANVANRQHNWMYPGATQSDPTGVSAPQAWGLNDTIQLAIANKKPIALPETGVMYVTDTTGVPDDAAFPIWLAGALAAAQAQGVTVAFVNVWDAGTTVNAGYGQWSLPGTLLVNTQKAWAAFGAGTALAPPAPPPPPAPITMSGTIAGTLDGGTFTLTGTGTWTPASDPPPFAPYGYVDNGGAGGDTITLPFKTLYPGDVIFVASNANVAGASKIQDTANLTWVRMVPDLNYQQEFLDIWMAVASEVVSTSISVTYPSGGFMLQVWGVSGADSAGPLEGTPGTFTYTGSATGTAEVTTTGPALVFGVFNQDYNQNPAPAAGWTALGALEWCLVSYQATPAAGTFSPGESPNNSDIWAAVAFAVAPAPAVVPSGAVTGTFTPS